LQVGGVVTVTSMRVFVVASVVAALGGVRARKM
jgi:hypothetical protein